MVLTTWTAEAIRWNWFQIDHDSVWVDKARNILGYENKSLSAIKALWSKPFYEMNGFSLRYTMLYRFECVMIKYNLNFSWSIMNMENFWGKRKYRGIEGWNSMVDQVLMNLMRNWIVLSEIDIKSSATLEGWRFLNGSSMFVDAWKVITYMDIWLWCLEWASLCPGEYEYIWP